MSTGSASTAARVLYVASAGIELSHYSTMYLFIGTLAVAWVAQQAIALSAGRSAPTDPFQPRRAVHLGDDGTPNSGIGSIAPRWPP